jgi:hypothetical protein
MEAWVEVEGAQFNGSALAGPSAARGPHAMLATMAARVPPSRWRPLLAALLAMAGCSAPNPPFAQLSGVILDTRLSDLSGLAASRVHPDAVWVLDDGGNPPDLYAVGNRGGVQATFRIAGVANTDWEDLAAFERDHRHYLLIADTGDNGGLRRTLQLHVVEEPGALVDGVLHPAWSIVFRWPDGPRDCEAVAVDAAHGQILLLSKRHRPPEVFVLPLRPPKPGLQVAQRIGRLAGMPVAGAPADAVDRLRDQVTAADLSPDGHTLAVLTYRDVLLYRRPAGQSWAQAIAGRPRVHPLTWLPQAEALGWSADGRSLYATGEHSPAPLLLLNP